VTIHNDDYLLFHGKFFPRDLLFRNKIENNNCKSHIYIYIYGGSKNFCKCLDSITYNLFHTSFSGLINVARIGNQLILVN